ncbi:MAG TPA: hypothetical protein VLM76_02210 [Patescibacteria group bacterium]|nr:hypothetical protein [Patescibacteria group bacterium]
MTAPPRLYKVLDENRRSMHGGRGRWTPGRWRSVAGRLVPCVRGLHLCRADQLIYWLGPRIWEVETDGEVIEAEDRYVARRARIVREVTAWNDQSARRFAADCAQDALQYADPEWRETLEVVLHTARAYADGEATDDELSAASAAAGAAAGAAASAAVDASWAAASAAASAAVDDAWAVAWPAARERHSRRLVSLLGIEP